MGACCFENYSKILDPKKAFDDIHESALYENGHGGYSGTIAEKSRYETRSAPLTSNKAKEFIYGKDDYDSENENFGDIENSVKWGDAFHVPICDDMGKIIGHCFYGYAPE